MKCQREQSSWQLQMKLPDDLSLKNKNKLSYESPDTGSRNRKQT